MNRYLRNKNTISSNLNDELVMIDVDLGKYFAMNSVASDIWDLLSEPKSVSELCSSLSEIYEIDVDSCQSQVQLFIDELMKKKLIKKSTS